MPHSVVYQHNVKMSMKCTRTCVELSVSVTTVLTGSLCHQIKCIILAM